MTISVLEGRGDDNVCVVRGIFTLLVPVGHSNEPVNLGRERTLHLLIGENVGWLCVLAAPTLVGLALVRSMASNV
jgi:hypothetical protein